MNTRTGLIGAGLACFLLFTVVSAPARLLMDLVPGDSVRISGVSGSIWNGQASAIRTPILDFSKTRWSLSAAALLSGRLGAKIDTEWAGGFGSAHAAIGFGGSIRLRDLEAAGSIAPLAGAFGLPVPGGDFTVSFSELELADAWPTRAVGSVRVGNIALTLPGAGAGPTGSFQAAFNADPVGQDGRLEAAISDLSGPLLVGGVIVLSPPANYEIAALIRTGPGATPQLVQGLQMLGPPDSDGNREFGMSGTF